MSIKELVFFQPLYFSEISRNEKENFDKEFSLMFNSLKIWLGKTVNTLLGVTGFEITVPINIQDFKTSNQSSQIFKVVIDIKSQTHAFCTFQVNMYDAFDISFVLAEENIYAYERPVWFGIPQLGEVNTKEAQVEILQQNVNQDLPLSHPGVKSSDKILERKLEICKKFQEMFQISGLWQSEISRILQVNPNLVSMLMNNKTTFSLYTGEKLLNNFQIYLTTRFLKPEEPEVKEANKPKVVVSEYFQNLVDEVQVKMDKVSSVSSLVANAISYPLITVVNIRENSLEGLTEAMIRSIDEKLDNVLSLIAKGKLIIPKENTAIKVQSTVTMPHFPEQTVKLKPRIVKLFKKNPHISPSNQTVSIQTTETVSEQLEKPIKEETERLKPKEVIPPPVVVKEAPSELKVLKNFTDLKKLEELKVEAVHPTGVRIPQFNTKHYMNQAKEIFKNFKGGEKAIRAKVTHDYFFSNRKGFMTISKNMMEVSKLTGIHFNSLKKVLTFANPPSAVEQIAFYNYLNDIRDVLIKIIEAEIPDK